MSLKYAEKVEIARQRELDEYREQILEILESSKQLALDCDNLVKMKALKARCDKISKPRPTLKTDSFREEQRKRYHENKQKYRERKEGRRQKIREISQANIRNFCNGVSV